MSKCLKCVHADFSTAQQCPAMSHSDVIFFYCQGCQLRDGYGRPGDRKETGCKGTMVYSIKSNASNLDGGESEEACTNFEKASIEVQKFVADMIENANKLQDISVGKTRSACVETQIRVQANDSRCCGFLCPYTNESSVFDILRCDITPESPDVLKPTGNTVIHERFEKPRAEYFRSEKCIKLFGG